MTFYKGGARRRRDANEPEIRAAITAVGGRSWQVSGLGLPDLIVEYPAYSRRFFLGEVKTATGKETPHQGAFPIWRSTADVFESLGIAQKEHR